MQKLASFLVILGSFFRAPRICDERKSTVHIWTPRTQFWSPPGLHFLAQDLLRFPAPWVLLSIPPWKYFCGPRGIMFVVRVLDPVAPFFVLPVSILAARARPVSRVGYKRRNR